MQDSIPESLGDPIELLYFYEYEPATADHSGAESTTSEPDSENEVFIDEDGPFRPDPPSHGGPPYPLDKSQHTEEFPMVEKECYSAAKRDPQSVDTTWATSRNSRTET